MSAADRQRAYRRRQRRGVRIARVSVDDAALSDVLVEAGFLDPLAADDPAAIDRALERLLAQLVAITINGA